MFALLSLFTRPAHAARAVAGLARLLAYAAAGVAVEQRERLARRLAALVAPHLVAPRPTPEQVIAIARIEQGEAHTAIADRAWRRRAS